MPTTSRSPSCRVRAAPARTCSSSSPCSDLRRAADLFRPVFDATDGVDGWVSLEVSPAIVDDTAKTTAAAARLHAAAAKPNLYIKIPGTPAGVKAIEASIFAGVPINVTLLFSREQYLAAAEAYLRGIERRIAAGLDPKVESVASLFVSRWDVAIKDDVPAAWRNRLGIAIARRTYKAYRDLLASPRWQKLAAAGARPQRLLWASTGTKDPDASDTLYVEALAAPDTVDTIPDKTLKAFADHGSVGATLRQRRRRRRGGDRRIPEARHRRRRAGQAPAARRRRLVPEVVGQPARRPPGQDLATRRSLRAVSLTPRSRLAGADGAPREDRHDPPARALRRRRRRGERLGLEAAGLYLDYSKNRISDETVTLLATLADERGVRERTAAMFRGDVINTTEKRSVLHVALRMPAGTKLVVDGTDVVAEVQRCWSGWRRSPTRCAAAAGSAIPASASGTSSTSASAAPTSGR